MLRRLVLSSNIRIPFRCLSSNGNGNGDPYYEKIQIPTLNLNEMVTGARIEHSKEIAPSYHPEQNTFNENASRVNLKRLNGGSVDLKKDDGTGIATVTINNPKKGNAITGSMMAALSDIVSELEVWSNGKAIILHGSPECRVFCAGADLALVKTFLAPDQGCQMTLFMQNTLNRLMRLPLVSVAAIHGKALGGGAEIATACDFRLMTHDAVVQFLQVRMGITPGWGGGSRLVRIVGPKTALKLLCSGKPVSSQDALRLDLADGLIDKTDIVGSAYDWLKDYTSGATEVVQANKCVVLAGTELPLDSAMRREKNLLATVWGGPAHLQALDRASKPKKD
ncbi:ethylmalonyl-CoA decarboxylase-like [Ptychodera flava]|uniref:ethylmalonyl-CoA decarboxylase-like n=1 Tax=Ptychodera flava TaxID=63121 RepID=UPI003969CBEF